MDISLNATQVVEYFTVENATSVGTTSVFVRYDSYGPAFMQEFMPVALYVDRYLTPIWYLIGITGNLFSARIWLGKRMRTNNSSAIYLATLSITDMCFLLMHIMQELKYSWGISTVDHPVVCEGYFALVLIAQYLSPILVLAFTVERWIAVCRPFQKEKFCTTSRAIKVVIGLVFLSAALGVMQTYLWQYDSESGQCTIRTAATEGGDKSLWSIWTWTTEMLIFLFVPLVMLTFNIMVIREVRKMSLRLPGQVDTTNASRATTVMLLSVSFYVIFTTLPATLVYALFSVFPAGTDTLSDADIREDPTWSSHFIYLTGRKVIEEICLSHYACNFFLYVITGVHFRKALIDMLQCKLYDRLKGGAYSEISNHNSKANWHQTHTTRV